MRRRRNADDDFQEKVRRKRGHWMYPFAQVKQEPGEGWFIDWLANPEGIPIDKVEIGDPVADWSLHEIVYWTVRDIDVDGGRIWLDPTDENPFITGVGAGGAVLTQYDWDVLTGAAHKRSVDMALRMVESGCRARYDMFQKLLKGIVATQFGPNGAQGGWYAPSDTSCVGSRQGMSAEEIVAWDAHALKRLGFDVPTLALRGKLDPYAWTQFVEGSDDINLKMRQTLLEGEDWDDVDAVIRFIFEHPVASIKQRNWNALLELWEPYYRRIVERETAPARWDDQDWVETYKRLQEQTEARWQAGELVRHDLEPIVRRTAAEIARLRNARCEQGLDFDPYYLLKEKAMTLGGRKGWPEVVMAHEQNFDPSNRKYAAWAWKEIGENAESAELVTEARNALLRMESAETHPEALGGILHSLEDLGVDPLSVVDVSPERYAEAVSTAGDGSATGYHANELKNLIESLRRRRRSSRNPVRNMDEDLRRLERRAASGDDLQDLRALSESYRRAGAVDDYIRSLERRLELVDLEVIPEVIDAYTRAGRVAPWDAVVVWRGILTGTGETPDFIPAGRTVEAIAVIEPRPNKDGWADPRVRVYVPVTGARGPGWAFVFYGVTGIPGWVDSLMNAPRLLPKPKRRPRR